MHGPSVLKYVIREQNFEIDNVQVVIQKVVSINHPKRLNTVEKEIVLEIQRRNQIAIHTPVAVRQFNNSDIVID